MKVFKQCILGSLIMLGTFSFAQTTTYKCVLELKNYVGEGAYVIASLLDANGAYVKTLAVMGDDDEWYEDFEEWYAFQKKKKEPLDAITGASVSPGARAVKAIKIQDAYLNKGYKIRFESAAEDKPYFPKDVEIPLTTDKVTKKYEGKGFLRFVKLSKL